VDPQGSEIAGGTAIDDAIFGSDAGGFQTVLKRNRETQGRENSGLQNYKKAK
jgi:hypothetical protein